ncbi:transposable element Tcb2 transposase [Trichonephila clavipes]|nr:transposable element Tcb2 transposase [Trichonephila clavipes]
MSTMSQRSHLTDSEAWRVVGRLERGQTQAEVAQAIGVSQSVISRIWYRFLETASAGRRPGQGRRRTTTSNEDRYLVLTARRHRNMNATVLQQHLRSATGTTVSTQIVRNRLHGVGLYVADRWDRTNGIASVFSIHKSNRARLGRSRKTSCWPPTTPQTLQELERAFLDEWDRIPQLVINSRIDSGAQRCWPSMETIPPTENDFL